ncbi:MAG: ABC transporter permease [Terracidiphilus sp.]
MADRQHGIDLNSKPGSGADGNRRAMFWQMIARFRSWFRALTHRSRLEADMEAELADHLERLTADLIRAGHSPNEAARRARVAFGPALKTREEMRASLGLRWCDELAADLRFAVRILRKSPGFTAIAAVSLALAIGANTAIFSLTKSLLYDQLGVPHAEQLRLLQWIGGDNNAVHEMWGEFSPAPGGGMMGPIFSYPVYQQLRDHNQVMSGLLGYNEDSMNATVNGTARRANVAMVTGNYFDVLEARPQLGRNLEPSDDRVGSASQVAVISDGLWERGFARSPSALGQTINVNQSLFTIVGVAPRGFTGAKNVQSSPDVFAPLSMQPLIDPKGDKGGLLDDPDLWWVNVTGRIKPGVTDAQAQAELNVELAAAIRGTMKVKAGDTLPRLVLSDGSRGLGSTASYFKKPVYVLMALTGFVLLLACANIANLMLARGAQRQREMSVRLALGASRGRILRQLLSESLLLATIGGAGGLLVGYLGRNLIPALMSNAWDQNRPQAPMDWGVFAFSAAVTLLTGFVFGLAPAWLATRSEVSSSLKESAQTTSRRRRGLGGKSIVAFQIALSTVLVVGAGLFLRTLYALDTIDVGFRADHLILFEISAPAQRYGNGKDVQLHQRLEQGFSALPGVESGTPSSVSLIGGSMSNQDFKVEGGPADDNHNNAEDVNITGNTFFQTMDIPIVSGRSFGAQDTASSQPVAVINQALAKKRFPNTNPIGKRFRTDGETNAWVTIAGVCADTHYATLRDPAPPQFFLPYVQQAQLSHMTFATVMTYAIRTRLSVDQIMPALRRVVQHEDRDLPIIDIRTQKEQIDSMLQMERTFAALTSGFGLLALALACVGIYGVMAYSVANRRNEIGIRLALGAQPGQVRGMILRESTWLAIAGIVAGTGAALGLTRLVKSMLYGIQPWDPATIVAGVLVLLLVALASSWIPARRAAGVQPMEALRHE